MEQGDKRVGQSWLERAESLASEPGEDLLRRLAGDGAVNTDEVFCLATAIEQGQILGKRLRIGLRLADLLRNLVVAVGQVDAARVRRVTLGHLGRYVAETHHP